MQDVDVLERSLLSRRMWVSRLGAIAMFGVGVLATVAFGISAIAVFWANERLQGGNPWWHDLLFYDLTAASWITWTLFLMLPASAWSAFAYLVEDARTAGAKLQGT